jgi:hypothetical protein
LIPAPIVSGLGTVGIMMGQPYSCWGFFRIHIADELVLPLHTRKDPTRSWNIFGHSKKDTLYYIHELHKTVGRKAGRRRLCPIILNSVETY